MEEVGLKGLKNGALIHRASSQFDVLITVDQNLPYQQNVVTQSIAIPILVCRSNRYSDLKTLVPKALKALITIQTGDVVRIE